jgi:hypothetical protein
MSDRICIIKHEAVPRCGSFEVRFPDGREPVYFYWDDLPSRRLRPETLDRETALERAKEFARAEPDPFAVRCTIRLLHHAQLQCPLGDSEH